MLTRPSTTFLGTSFVGSVVVGPEVVGLVVVVDLEELGSVVVVVVCFGVGCSVVEVTAAVGPVVCSIWLKFFMFGIAVAELELVVVI